MEYLICLEAQPARIVKITLGDGKKETLFDITNGTPDGIWIDQKAQKIYWTIMGKLTDPPEGYLAADGSIEYCNLDGSGHSLLLGNGLITTPKQLIGDPDTNRLYWCDREGMAVQSCLNDGSGFEVLVQHEKDDTDPDEVEKHCVGITLDPRKEYLYWTQKGPAKGGKGKIFRLKLAQQFPVKEPSIELLMDHLAEPIDLEFGEKTGRLYWTDRGAAPFGNSLNCADISEKGKLINHRVITTGLKEGIGLAVDEHENAAYTSDLGGYIRKINLTDNSASIILQQGPTTGIALVKE
ncbi:MAG: hypothetical protein ACN6O7_19085 [Sphingobacterium sp.]